MAFRASASAFTTTTGNITATPAGVTAHDYLGGVIASIFIGATITPPSGWTQQVNNDQSSPGGKTHRYCDKNDAAGGGSDSFTFSSSSNGNHLECAAWSGRNNTTPLSTTPVATQQTTAQTSPYTFPITGITATSGDDIAIFKHCDQLSGFSRWSWTPPTSYTEAVDDAPSDYINGAMDYRDNVSGGATGTLNSTMSAASPGSGSGAGAIVVAIAASGGGGGGITYPQLERGIRGLNRGLAIGVH